MPKQTYYNLPDDKRDRIIEAIKREFSRVPVARVSINRIICDAGISRGSFYQYFEDKDDLVRFVLNVNRRNMLDRLDEMFVQDGDIFVTMTRLFDEIVSLGQSNQEVETFKNMYLGIGIGDPAMVDERNDVMELAKRVGADHIKAQGLESIKDLLAAVDILYGTFKNSVLQLCGSMDNPNEVREHYIRKLEILKAAITIDGNKQGESEACQSLA